MRKCNSRRGGWRRLAVAAGAGLLAMQVTQSVLAAPIGLGGANPTTYTQSFDSLSNTEPGTAPSNPWADDSTISGWYMSNNNNGAAQTFYRASPPSTFNATGSMSLGPSGSTDRALGGRGNDSRYAVLLQNTSGGVVNEVDPSYTVELWRTGDASSQDSMTFFYQLLSSVPTTTPTTGGTFTQVPAMTVTFGDPTTGFSPANTNSTVGATHPYVPSSSVNGAVTGLNWQPGQYLMLEWVDHNNATFTNGGANDAAMGIDDVNISLGSVPEPSMVCVFGLAALMTKRKRSC